MNETKISRIIRLAGIKSDPHIMFCDVLDLEVRSAKDATPPEHLSPSEAFIYALAIAICDSQNGNDVLDRMDKIVNDFFKDHPSLHPKAYDKVKEHRDTLRELIERLEMPKNRHLLEHPF